MKIGKQQSILALAALLALPAWAAKFTVTASGARFRDNAGWGSSSKIQGVIYRNDTVEVTGPANCVAGMGCWYPVTTSDGRSGWINHRLMSPSTGESAPVAQATRPASPPPLPKPPPVPKAEPKIEPKVEPKAEPKVEPKAEPKVEPKVEPKTKPKAEPKPAPKPGEEKAEQPGQETEKKEPVCSSRWDKNAAAMIKKFASSNRNSQNSFHIAAGGANGPLYISITSLSENNLNRLAAAAQIYKPGVTAGMLSGVLPSFQFQVRQLCENPDGTFKVSLNGSGPLRATSFTLAKTGSGLVRVKGRLTVAGKDPRTGKEPFVQIDDTFAAGTAQ